MINDPFRMFAPYADRLQVVLFTKEDTIGNDDAIAKKMGTETIASLKQVHGNRTIIVREPQRRVEAADGMWTNERDVMLTIRIADCQSFVAYAPKQHVVGLLHSGWRGLVSGAIAEFFKKLDEDFSIAAADVLVGAGPSLCNNCAEFTDPVKELVGIDPQFFNGRHADLRAIADRQLIDIGVRKEHIERHSDCTRCENETWWSYRGGDREAVSNGLENALTCRLIEKNSSDRTVN